MAFTSCWCWFLPPLFFFFFFLRNVEGRSIATSFMLDINLKKVQLQTPMKVISWLKEYNEKDMTKIWKRCNCQFPWEPYYGLRSTMKKVRPKFEEGATVNSHESHIMVWGEHEGDAIKIWRKCNHKLPQEPCYGLRSTWRRCHQKLKKVQPQTSTRAIL
mgnify:CR=1 FL=1